MKTGLRVVAYVLFATFVVVVNVLSGALLYLTTNRAREQALRIGLHQLAHVFPGGIKVARSEGDLLRGLVLQDIEIDDLDGRPAVQVERLELSYSLVALLLTRVRVDRLKLDGAVVFSQPLADGRDNLATLAVIKKLPPLPRALPISVLLDELAVDARFVRRGPGESRVRRDHDLRAQIHAHADLSHGMIASLGELRVDLTSPASATLTVHGAAHIAKEMVLRDVDLRLSGDTTELRRRVDKLRLSGPVSLFAHANGPIDDLAAVLSLDTHEPRVHLHADGHVYANRVELHELRVHAPFAQVRAHGRYRYDRTGDAVVHADANDLSALALFGAPALEGAVKLDATVERDASHLRAHLVGKVNGFRAGNERVGQASVDLSTVDFSGEALVLARDMLLGSVQLRSARVESHGDNKAIRVTATAQGPEGLEVDLEALGAPRVDDGHVIGFEAGLESLRFGAGGTPWQLAHPAHFSADFDAQAYTLSRLDLTNDAQHISLEGRLLAGNIEQASAVIEHFDLSQLPALLSPGHVLPHSDVNAALEAKGPIDLPNVGGHFTAEADGNGTHDLIHVTATGEGRLKLGRLNAKTFVTIGGQKVSAKVDMPMPLRAHQPIDVSFDAKVLLNAWFANLIVPKFIQTQPIILYTLGAMVTAQGSISGTTSNPRVDASARVARWGAGNSHGNIAASVEYHAGKLGLSSTLDFSELPAGGGNAAGIVNATAELPVDLAPMFSGRHGRLLDRDAPMHASFALHHIDVARLPFEGFAVVPIVRHGKVDGNVDFGGTWAHPKATTHLDARDLDVGGVHGIAVQAEGRLDGTAATCDLRVAVQGSDALHAHATVGESGIEVRDWTLAPITAAIDSSGFDLGRLELFTKVDGNVNGSMTMTGSWAQPKIVAHARVDGLRSGDTSFRRWEISARVQDDSLSGQLLAEEEHGGSLEAHIDAPHAGKLEGQIQAKRFPLDVRSELLPGLRQARALLDGKIALVGTRTLPSLAGAFAISAGELLLANSAISYHALEGRLRFERGKVVLQLFRGETGNGGGFDGDASLSFRGLAPQTLVGMLHLRRYPVAWESLSALVDANVALDGKRVAQGFFTNVQLSDARVTLVDGYGLRGLIPLVRLDDIRVGTARPVPLSSPLSKPRSEPTSALVVALRGPMSVHGGEIDAQATSKLDIDLTTDVPTATGAITLSAGTVRLYGQVYDLDRGSLRFDATRDAFLDLRVARTVKRARIGLELGGSTRQPTMHFFAEPPEYDAAQVASMVTGQRRETGGVAKKGIGDKTKGPLSSLIATSFRQADPASEVVDVARPVRAQGKLDADAAAFPPPTK